MPVGSFARYARAFAEIEYGFRETVDALSRIGKPVSRHIAVRLLKVDSSFVRPAMRFRDPRKWTAETTDAVLRNPIPVSRGWPAVSSELFTGAIDTLGMEDGAAA